MTGALQRDWVMELHEANRPGLIAAATQIARELCARDGSTCMPRVLRVMRARGWAAIMSTLDPRWSGAVLLPSRGWERTGEIVREGSRARPVPMWRPVQ